MVRRQPQGMGLMAQLQQVVETGVQAHETVNQGRSDATTEFTLSLAERAGVRANRKVDRYFILTCGEPSVVRESQPD